MRSSSSSGAIITCHVQDRALSVHSLRSEVGVPQAQRVHGEYSVIDQASEGVKEGRLLRRTEQWSTVRIRQHGCQVDPGLDFHPCMHEREKLEPSIGKSGKSQVTRPNMALAGLSPSVAVIGMLAASVSRAATVEGSQADACHAGEHPGPAGLA